MYLSPPGLGYPCTFYRVSINIKNYCPVSNQLSAVLASTPATAGHCRPLTRQFRIRQPRLGLVPGKAVHELLGLCDMKITMRYAHLAPAHLRDSANVLYDLGGGKQGEGKLIRAFKVHLNGE